MKRTRHALRGHAAFRRVFAGGQRIDGTLLRCIAQVESSSGNGLRVGFAVSSRTYGAVQRNRLRRLMREAFAGERSGLLEALGGTGRRLSAVFAFKSSRAVDIRRLKVQAVCADMAGVCRQLRKRL